MNTYGSLVPVVNCGHGLAASTSYALCCPENVRGGQNGSLAAWLRAAVQFLKGPCGCALGAFLQFTPRSRCDAGRDVSS